MKKDVITEWVRNCPKCHENVYHKNKRTGDAGEGRNCYECKRKDMTLQFAGEKNPMFNKTHSIETREKLRKHNQGKKHSQESIEKMRNKLKGMKRSVETRRNISLSKIGEKNPFYGKIHSENVINILKEKLTGKHIGNKNPFYGKSHTEEVKTKLREMCLDRINASGQFIGYNKISCEFFDILNNKMNWVGRHALNRGEYQSHGYSIDYFETNLNLIIEWDEPRHNHQKVKQADMIRQRHLIDKLNCQFYRIDETRNVVYKVDNNFSEDYTQLIQETLNEFQKETKTRGKFQ